MGARWTAWHFFFGSVLRKRGPRGIEVRDEVPLSVEPPRVDYLLVRKPDSLVDSRAQEAGTLRKLWPMLPRVSVMEYKSPTRGYRHADLDRLWGYVHIHFANERALASPRPSAAAPEASAAPEGAAATQGAPVVRAREDLCAVLVVARRTPSLDSDIASMGLRWEDCGDGYWRVHGGLFSLYVVEIDVAGPAEQDDLLYSLGHGKATTPAAKQFWLELVGSKEAPMSLVEMEGYEELVDRVLSTLPRELVLSHYKPEERLAGLRPDERLAGLRPDERLAGLPPEERLAGLDRDHAALALPLDVLRALPDAYLATLSPEVQAELRHRLGKNGHTR